MSSVKNAKKLYNEKPTKDRIFFFLSGATAMKNATTSMITTKHKECYARQFNSVFLEHL